MRAATCDVPRLLSLLIVTGLRISEARRGLSPDDIDWAEGILTIRGTKFGKSRLVPVHPSSLAALPITRGTATGSSMHGSPAASSSPIGANRWIPRWSIRRSIDLSRQAGLRTAGASHGPRLHDFRHRFALKTLVQWYRVGEDVERRLPLLSTYLGHVRVSDTY
jgi:integrase/recombinase XerD